MDEMLEVLGRYEFVCRDEDGNELWREVIDNVVCTLGKNALFDAALRSGYTLVGPFLGLISSVSFTAVNLADTMASHAGWLEAGSTNAPTFAARQTAVFAAASGGASAITPLVFTFTGGGTVQGGFMCYGTGAVATLMNTSGVLLSASAFGAAQPVLSGNTLTVSYSISG